MSVYVAKVKELPVGGCRVVQVGEKPVAVFHTESGYHALTDYCSHRAGPLSEGTLQGDVVTCPWHGSQFDLKTGKPLCKPAVQNVATYKVQVVGDEILIAD